MRFGLVALSVVLAGTGIALLAVSLSVLQERETQRQSALKKTYESIKMTDVSEEKGEKEMPDIAGLEVHFIDVGQGDGALLLSGRHAAMIDVGSSSAGKTDVVKYLEERNIDKLDYLIFSHGHEDHTGASYEIFWKSDIEVEQAVCDFGNKEEGNVVMAESSLLEKGIPVLPAKTGDSFQMGDVTFQVLMGREPELEEKDSVETDSQESQESTKASGEELSSVNNQSLAILVSYGDTSFLFYGDGETAYEKLLATHCQGIAPVTVLKAAHHGGNTSTQDEILDVLKPKHVVVSSEAPSRYGFPSPKVLERLEQRDIPVYCTYQLGTIVVKSDGTSVEFITEKE